MKIYKFQTKKFCNIAPYYKFKKSSEQFMCWWHNITIVSLQNNGYLL